jgi:glycosyltransferase involved in cell wall biosynthesis
VRILLVAPYFPPQLAVASLRTHAFAATWARAGHAVTVLTTAKRADQRGLELSSAGFAVAEVAYRIPWLFEKLRGRHRAEEAALPICPTAPGAGWFQLLRRVRARTGIFSAVRMPDLTDFWVKPAIAWARAGPGWDMVVSSSGPHTAHLVARAVKAAGRARFWTADFRDLWTDNHLYCGLFPFTLREYREERSCLQLADLLVTVTDGLAERLAARAGKPVTVIYNGYDPEVFATLSAAPVYPPDGRVRLVYTGTLYPHGQDPTPLFAALRQLQAPQRSRLALVVAGPSCEHWRDLARRHDALDLLEGHGLVPREEALRLQRDAAALLLLDWHDPDQGVLTGKVFEYLRAPGPILVIGGRATSPLGKLIADTGRGYHLGQDPERIARALSDLVEAPQRLAQPIDLRLIETLSRPRQSLRLLAHLELLTQHGQRASGIDNHVSAPSLQPLTDGQTGRDAAA